MKILIFGLPGSGKTHLAERLAKHLECAWFNADEIRRMANDWNFDENARVRQARRMRNVADFEKSHGRTVICDFVCPTPETREAFGADMSIFMDTIESGRFADTNRVFERPPAQAITFWIKEFVSDEDIKDLANVIKENYSV
jgi:adenylylsulfate kinase